MRPLGGSASAASASCGRGWLLPQPLSPTMPRVSPGPSRCSGRRRRVDGVQHAADGEIAGDAFDGHRRAHVPPLCKETSRAHAGAAETMPRTQRRAAETMPRLMRRLRNHAGFMTAASSARSVAVSRMGGLMRRAARGGRKRQPASRVMSGGHAAGDASGNSRRAAPSGARHRGQQQARVGMRRRRPAALRTGAGLRRPRPHTSPPHGRPCRATTPMSWVISRMAEPCSAPQVAS